MGATSDARRPPCAPCARCPVEQHERDAERQRLLGHHHHRCETLVGERGETEEAIRLLGVRVVEDLWAERDHVGEDLTRPEEQCCVAGPLAHRQAVVAGRVDDLRPDEQTGEDEAQVLEGVHDRVRERSLVQRRHVPTRENDQPRDEAHPRLEQEGERPS